MSEVVVVATGTANTASVLAGLRRAGAEPVLSTDPDVVQAARIVVLPGVGAFSAAKEKLDEAGLTEIIAARVREGRPLLGICLGLQLLCDASEESPGVAGLGVVRGNVTRFSDEVRVPQLGWNTVVADEGCRLLQDGAVSFANSYRLERVPEGWLGAVSSHGGPFVAAIERGAVLACQFHPELSGAYGQALLRRWLAVAEAWAGEGEVGVSSAKPSVHTLTRRVIPCLDVKDGRIVKGVKFQGLRDAGDPVERAAAYEAQGADELVILDVSATTEGRANAAETVAAVRAVLSIPLTVGGGVRAVADAARLLGAGADKVAVNSAAVLRPELLTELATTFGRQCTVLAIDAAERPEGGWEVVTRGGRHRTGIDVVGWAADGVSRGAGEILLTSWDRDGTRSGYDLALLKAVTEAVGVPVIASGGADTAQHLVDGLSAGADAVLAASIFHDDDTTVATIKAQLAEAGVSVRTSPEETT